MRRAFDEGWPRVCDSVPQRVKREANAYQRCGDVRYGFSEVTCEGCEASRLVAFCCKGRMLVALDPARARAHADAALAISARPELVGDRLAAIPGLR